MQLPYPDRNLRALPPLKHLTESSGSAVSIHLKKSDVALEFMSTSVPALRQGFTGSRFPAQG